MLIIWQDTISKNGPNVEFRQKNNEIKSVIDQKTLVKKELNVRNCHFSGSNEFYFDGQRITGALTIKNSNNITIENCTFISNDGDDGLNIKGGSSLIRRNYFSGNRDAIDVDDGYTIISQNIFAQNKDDAIDLGNVKKAIVSNNYITRQVIKGFLLVRDQSVK